MNIVKALFSVARQISDSDLDEINKLEEKANQDVLKYHSDMPGIKGKIAKSRESWIFNLALIYAIPFVTVALVNYKNQIFTKPKSVEELSFDDDDFEEFEDEL
jgi:hypothetical protein